VKYVPEISLSCCAFCRGKAETESEIEKERGREGEGDMG